jgi:hypothetical protein
MAALSLMWLRNRLRQRISIRPAEHARQKRRRSNKLQEWNVLHGLSP